MPKEKLLYVETYGCQMNVSDSEKIVALLQPVGYHPHPGSLASGPYHPEYLQRQGKAGKEGVQRSRQVQGAEEH